MTDKDPEDILQTKTSEIKSETDADQDLTRTTDLKNAKLSENTATQFVDKNALNQLNAKSEESEQVCVKTKKISFFLLIKQTFTSFFSTILNSASSIKESKVTILWSLLCVLIITSFFYFSWFEILELKSLDSMFKLHSKVKQSDLIVIAEINDESVHFKNGIGQWPWSRKIHAVLVKNLIDYFSPLMIGFDVLFLNATDKLADFAFARVMKKSDLVYLPYALNFSEDDKDLFYNNIDSMEETYKLFSDAAKGQGHINFKADIDGNIRRIPLVMKRENKWYPHLSFKMIIDLFDVDFKDVKIIPGKHIKFNAKEKKYIIPIDENCQTLIAWVGKWKDSFKHISCLDIAHVKAVKQLNDVKSRFKIDDFKNKIFIIGDTTKTTVDARKTPFDDRCPLVNTHALIINQFLNNFFLTEVSFAYNYLYVLVIFVFIAYTVLNCSPGKSLLLSVIMIGLLFLISLLFFEKFNMVLNLMRPIYTVIITFLLLGTYNHIRYKNHVDLKLSFEQKLSMADAKLPQFRANLKIGQYSNISELGRGGMAIVYKGTGKDGKEYAIKVINPDCLAKDNLFKYRFKREIATMKKVVHKNVIRVFNSGTYQGVLYYSMEYFPSGDLSEHLMKLNKVTDYQKISDFLLTLFRGLKAIHDANLIHRDIKPANIMVNQDLEVKIADFGLAKHQDEGQVLTTVGQVLGTPAYLAPELCKGEDPSFSADIYAMGIIVYELFAATRPFAECNSMAALMHAKLKTKVPTIKLKNIDIPDNLADIVDKLVEADPLMRYKNCDEVISDLIKFANIS